MSSNQPKSGTSPTKTGDTVHYEVETSTGGKGIVVYEVNEVYVYIPAELSAAGFELKIAGSVNITDKVSVCEREINSERWLVNCYCKLTNLPCSSRTMNSTSNGHHLISLTRT